MPIARKTRTTIAISDLSGKLMPGMGISFGARPNAIKTVDAVTLRPVTMSLLTLDKICVSASRPVCSKVIATSS
jgi:hypothetical protein